MKSMTALEAKTRFGELLERVMKGEEVAITRHDKVVARLIPDGQPTSNEVNKAVDGLLAIQERTRKYAGDRTPEDWETLKAWVNEGRK
jgi:prevent-host-death family protein